MQHLLLMTVPSRQAPAVLWMQTRTPHKQNLAKLQQQTHKNVARALGNPAAGTVSSKTFK
jgi:hypothetical protein